MTENPHDKIYQDTPELLLADIKRAVGSNHNREVWEQTEPWFLDRYKNISEEINRSHEQMDPEAQRTIDEISYSTNVMSKCERRILAIVAIYFFSQAAELKLADIGDNDISGVIFGIKLSGLDTIDLVFAVLILLTYLHAWRCWHICRQKLLPFDEANSMYNRLTEHWEKLVEISDALVNYSKSFWPNPNEQRYSLQQHVDRFRQQSTKRKTQLHNFERGALAIGSILLTISVFYSAANHIPSSLEHLFTWLCSFLGFVFAMPGILAIIMKNSKK